MFEALMSFLIRKNICQCFENPTQDLYLWLVDEQLKYFNVTMLKLERQKTSAVNVSIILTQLKSNLHEKRVSDFIFYQAKRILEKLKKDGEVDAKFFLNETRCFYEKCESYVDVYHDFYEDVTSHLWLNSSEDLSWTLVCASAEKINCMFGKQIIDNASLFDDHVVVKNYNSASDRREIWPNTPIISYEQKWTQLFQAFKDKYIPISNFQKLVKFVFCLPGTSAPVKRIS